MRFAFFSDVEKKLVFFVRLSARKLLRFVSIQMKPILMLQNSVKTLFE